MGQEFRHSLAVSYGSGPLEMLKSRCGLDRAAVTVRHVRVSVCFQARLSGCWQDLGFFCGLVAGGFPLFLAKWPLHGDAYIMAASSEQGLKGKREWYVQPTPERGLHRV